MSQVKEAQAAEAAQAAREAAETARTAKAEREKALADQVVYANADKDKLVPEGSDEAAYVVNVDHPGEFAHLLPAGKAEARQAERQAERTAEREAAETKAGRKAEDK